MVLCKPARWALTFLLTTCLFLWANGRAEAFQVVSGGVTYEITLTSVSPSKFRDLSGTSDPTQNPWWGERQLALDIAAAVPSQVFTDFGVTQLDFAFARRTSNFVDYAFATSTNPGVGAFAERNVNADPAGVWAFGTLSVVPEIDGPILMQALFILGAVYALLRGRRRRSALTA